MVIGDQYILQRLAFLRDFQFGITLSAFVSVIIFDKQSVQQGTGTRDLLNQYQAPVFLQTVEYCFYQFLPVQGAYKLECQQQNDDRAIVYMRQIMQVGVQQLDFVFTTLALHPAYRNYQCR